MTPTTVTSIVPRAHQETAIARSSHELGGNNGSTAQFTVAPDVCSSSDNDGTTILDVARDKIYSVIGVGSLIWTKLADADNGLALATIVEDLSGQFKDVPCKQIERDVEQLLKSFQRKGIVIAGNEPENVSHPRAHLTRLILLFRKVAALLVRLRLYTLASLLGLAATNVVLRVFGFRVLRHVVKSWSVVDDNPPATAEEEVCQAVNRATSWYPRQAMCLQRSAITACLLRHHGVPAEMVIGCRKIPFKAHAWVEVGNRVVNDKKQVQEFYSVLDRC